MPTFSTYPTYHKERKKKLRQRKKRVLLENDGILSADQRHSNANSTIGNSAFMAKQIHNKWLTNGIRFERSFEYCCVWECAFSFVDSVGTGRVLRQ